ncbi:tolB protein-related [Abeliophyllum distichum]|uniref:TolB protein-related n=1 Tax=Abeliophyllum distichum TaxID=126358 RepID=A0ABD1TCK9_9LAMI
MEPTGTIVFTTIGRVDYGFDIFSAKLPTNFPDNWDYGEHCLTDGISINFNGQFSDEDETITYVSERSGSSRIYLNRPHISKHELIQTPTESLFHDRPVINNGLVYYVSAHEPPEKPFRSWSALYSTRIDDGKTVRLTPYGSVDYSPAISKSGKFIAVASYGSQRWRGEFHDLQTDIVVFPDSDPTKRVVISQHGGWPTWSGDSTIYFHRQADDGWWSIFRVELPENFEDFGSSAAPFRVTPPDIHCFTPAAMHNKNSIAIATRRKDKNYRHIEIFDVDSRKFYPVTEVLNPNFHHYNPFISPESTFLGYHRFPRRVSMWGDNNSTS